MTIYTIIDKNYIIYISTIEYSVHYIYMRDILVYREGYLIILSC